MDVFAGKPSGGRIPADCREDHGCQDCDKEVSGAQGGFRITALLKKLYMQ